MSNLIVPVYLNQKLVFDLLAMLQGGISTITAVSRTQESVENTSSSVSGGFGLGEALSMLMRVDLSGSQSKADSLQAGETQAEERVHTPASLLYQLRNSLSEADLLITPEGDNLPYPGQFVEFQAALRRNPIVEVLDSFAEMMELAEAFGSHDSRGGGNPGSQNKSGRGKGGRKRADSEYAEIKKQMTRLSESLKAGDSIDLTAPDVAGAYNAVITVETKYLNDPAMADLVDGNFRVLGKVVRQVSSSSESISLLRKTALSKMPPRQLDQVFGALQGLSSTEEFDLPEISWETQGPAIQVIPVAIYA